MLGLLDLDLDLDMHDRSYPMVLFYAHL